MSNAQVIAYHSLKMSRDLDKPITRVKGDTLALTFLTNSFSKTRKDIVNPQNNVAIFFISNVNTGISHPDIIKAKWHFIINDEVYTRLSYRDVAIDNGADPEDFKAKRYRDAKGNWRSHTPKISRKRAGYRLIRNGRLIFFLKKLDIDIADLKGQIKL